MTDEAFEERVRVMTAAQVVERMETNLKNRPEGLFLHPVSVNRIVELLKPQGVRNLYAEAFDSIWATYLQTFTDLPQEVGIGDIAAHICNLIKGQENPK